MRVPATPLSPVARRLLARARGEYDQGRLAAAEASLGAVLALAPTHPDALRALGMVSQRLHHHEQAADCYRRALALAPDDAAVHMGLGISLQELADVDGALLHLRQACTLAPASAGAWFNLGKVLSLAARPADALPALQRALDLDPTRAAARLLQAQAQANLGQIEQAVAGFRAVLRAHPADAEAWFGLSNLNVGHLCAGDVQALQAALARFSPGSRGYELLNFALAKALECLGDNVAAFDAYARANASRRRHVAWSAAAERARVDAIERAFAGAPRPLPDSDLGANVIFIVSVPRSGSSLVEQILASHSQVEGANEIVDMTRVIDDETRRRRVEFPGWVADASDADWRRLGSEYLARTAHWRVHKPRFTDKSLLTWHVVGAALRMLPAARVIVVHRDPVETCLGCYRQLFGDSLGFTCDLDDLADYYEGFARLAHLWLRQFPARVLDLRYEALVDAPERVIRKLLEFCGLPFEQACIEFHKTVRPVLSLPSAAQVRQPLQHGTARADRYGDRLDALRRRLADVAV